MPYIEPREVFEYARRYADNAEAAGRGTEFPTVRMAAKRFKCTQDDITTSIEDGCDGVAYFGLSVGVCIGMGGGWASHDTEGDYEIEAYRD